MNEFFSTVPWGYLGVGYIGLLAYILTSLLNTSDESISSIGGAFSNHGRTILTAALVIPVLILGAQELEQLTWLSAFAAGYANMSLMRKFTDSIVATSRSSKSEP